MKLKTYIKQLQKIADKYPNLDVIYSCDEEGNTFTHVNFPPTVGYFHDGDFDSQVGAEDKNSICIN